MKYIFLFVIFFIFTSQAFADGKLFPINKIDNYGKFYVENRTKNKFRGNYGKDKILFVSNTYCSENLPYLCACNSNTT